MERKKRVVPRETCCGKFRKRQPLYKQKQGSAERTGVSRSHRSREVKDRIVGVLSITRERRVTIYDRKH